MVSLYFGLPGCGKTTILTSIAYKYAKKCKPYKHIYSNIDILVPGVVCIDNECIGVYDLSDSLILIDEATLFADSRDFKNFDKDKLYFFNMHRHFNTDIVLFTQRWDAVDLKIRTITDRVYYCFKTPILGNLFHISQYYRIPYGIIIPDKKDNTQKLGEIIQGYCKPNFLVRLLSHKVYRPKYYPYFDSWEHKSMPELPLKYKQNYTRFLTLKDYIKLKIDEIKLKFKIISSPLPYTVGREENEIRELSQEDIKEAQEIVINEEKTIDILSIFK